jgi:hypothetical protein
MEHVFIKGRKTGTTHKKLFPLLHGIGTCILLKVLEEKVKESH